MSYILNPLLKQLLQKKQLTATPEDVQRLQEEIDTLTANVANKVPKFFISIEEIEVGETGEYQGETNPFFHNSWFYKRQAADNTLILSEEGTLQLFRKQDFRSGNATIYTPLSEGFLDFVRLGTEGKNVYLSYTRTYNNIQYVIFVFTPEFNLISDYYVTPEMCGLHSFSGFSEGYLYGYAVKGIDSGQTLSAPPEMCEIVVSNGYLCINDNGELIRLVDCGGGSAWGSSNGYWIAYWFVNNKLVPCHVIGTSSYSFIISEDAEQHLRNAIFGQVGRYLGNNVDTWDAIDITRTLYSIVGITTEPWIRVDTQPALDPTDFATAGQGAKADTALQGISEGTDGDYITTTVTDKDANNQQTVGASLTIQDIAAADSTHKGLAEALNTRNYIDTQVYNVSLNFFFYGVQWNENDPSPDCTRIGNMSLHAELPIQNAIIGGLLQDDLTFTPFADQSDWSGETVDGSAGQLMLQIPKHYFKSEINGTIHKKLISQYPLAGFIEIPMMYVSAEKATVDRTDPNTPKLCSVVNTTAAFRGGQNTADWDNTYRSLLGKPASNISLTNFRQYARNRGNGTAWNCHTYLAQRVLYWLFVTEYATLNSQKAFNAAKDVNGYAQGGLGPGVSNWNSDAWNAYNGYNPLIPCGYMLEFGNKSATKNYSVKDANDNILVTVEVNSYRGIQSPFADIWDCTDGILINVQSDTAGGVSTCYITDDPAKFSSTDFSQYREVGVVPRAESWIKTIYDGEAGDIICKSVPGSSTSYYCDYYWGLKLPASGVSLRGVRFGGAATSGSLCGFLYAHSNLVPGSVHPDLGSRLCAFPSP